MNTTTNPTLYGLIAEFDRPDQLLAAAERAREAGYVKMDAYSPYPVHGLDDALGVRKTILPWLVLGAGIIGAATGFGMQYYASVIDYPLNIGGRPFNSWPSFIVITFEMTILLAGVTAVVGMILLNGLPQPYHPVFNASRFELASQTAFFLCIEAADPRFDVSATRQFLQETGAARIEEIPFDPRYTG